MKTTVNKGGGGDARNYKFLPKIGNHIYLGTLPVLSITNNENFFEAEKKSKPLFFFDLSSIIIIIIIIKTP